MSDHIWEMGMPFQCFVPHALMTVSVNESDIERDAASTLRRVAEGIGPLADERMRHLIRHFRRDLLWRVQGSRVAENLLIEAARAAASFEGRSLCCPIVDRTL